MASRSKPSGVSGIGSEHSVFLWARLKLTGIYVLIVAAIVIGFSAFLYQSLAQNLSDVNDTDFVDSGSQQHFVSYALGVLENDIVLVDIVIIVCAGLVGYVLAGYTLRPIRRSLEAQREFAEKASHELRTPLAVMKNDMEILLRNHAPSKELVRDTLESNIEEIDHLTTMTTDLLALARSRHDTRLNKETVSVEQVIQAVSENVRPLAEKKGVLLSITGPTFSFAGSTFAVERVLTNLIQNALEHTPSGGTITIATDRDTQRGTVVIRDTGAGIKKEDIPHVFERFYKGQNAKGSGLGLAIVKELTEGLGGRVVIESVINKGTTVTLSFPLV